MNVEPRLKEMVECPCGCGSFGTPTKNGHPKACPDTCPRCRGRRNRGRGKRAERQMRRVTGVQVASNAHAAIGEEAWSSAFRWECKAGKQVDPIATRFLAAEAQSEGSRAIGDARPFGMLARPTGMTDGLVLVRGNVWRSVIQPALDDMYGGGR